MAGSNNALTVTDLDFFSIRENLKNFLRNQDSFTDYDYEGSGMSVLLDILAYNTYYNAYYMNMIANEAFLDTAQLRPNILSHAKVINYVPTSARGSEAKINVVVTPNPASEITTRNQLTLRKYTRLLGSDIDGVNHPFVTLHSNTVPKTGNSFNFSNVVIKQGEAMTYQFRMEANNITRSFQIPSANVDTTTLRVQVQESISNTFTTEYTLARDLTELRSDSRVFFVEENDNLFYNIYFGDNILGMRPKNGSIVITTFVDTVGSIANNVNRFVFVDKIGNIYSDNVRITTVESSRSGQDKETIEQIKFRAPYAYSAQNRAVTTNDYESLIIKDYNNIDAISVWGGEDNDPPIYGKVFISLKTKGYYSLSTLDKENIKTTLIKNRNVLTVDPEIIDPDYIFVQMKGTILYNPNLTSKDGIALISDVKDAIGRYATENLDTFKATFRKAQLQTYIESADPAITGSDVNVYLQKRLLLTLNQTKNYKIPFNTALRKGDYINKLYSFPQISVNDSSFTTRQVFFEEVPDSFTGVDSVNMISAGLNYDSFSTRVTIVGDGVGATAEPVVINGKITQINIINKGSNYTRATVLISSDIGSGASAVPVLQAKIGNLRSYYFKTNGEKVIVNNNAGVINYETGMIELISLTPLAVETNDFYENNYLTISVVPQDQTIVPSRNRILTIDIENSQSVQLDVAESA